MEEAWKLDQNPFPAEAIRIEAQPYSPGVFIEEADEFRRKLIRGAIQGNVNIGFLWSQGLRADTGFGKTTLMQEITKEINRDFGVHTLTRAGVRPRRRMPIVAAYSNLNNLTASGLYPVLFNAVLDLTRAREQSSGSIFDKARERIVENLGTDESSEIADHLRSTWLQISGTGAPLRQELVQAFASGEKQAVEQVLGAVSQAARLRNGLQYLDFALCVLAAANIDHLYLMIDQLEDLATTRTITAAKRSREIGRIRDMLEGAPYANRVHFIFTFHNSAAQVLERFWEQNRLPPFEISPSNIASVVVLRGLKDDDQVRELLRVYLDEHRDGVVEEELLPFEPGAIAVLRTVSEGRVGILLNRAHELLNFAAQQGVPRISGKLAREFFEGNGELSDIDVDSEEGGATTDIDDLLLGSRS
jgi:hypothetical protein